MREEFELSGNSGDCSDCSDRRHIGLGLLIVMDRIQQGHQKQQIRSAANEKIIFEMNLNLIQKSPDRPCSHSVPLVGSLQSAAQQSTCYRLIMLPSTWFRMVSIMCRFLKILGLMVHWCKIILKSVEM